MRRYRLDKAETGPAEARNTSNADETALSGISAGDLERGTTIPPGTGS